MRKIFSALDLGTSSLKLIVGEFINDKFVILCALSEPTYGLNSAEIVNEEHLLSSINKLLIKAEEQLNFKIKKVIINIPNLYTNFYVTEATNTINNDEEIVKTKDILEVLQASISKQISVTDELVSIMPIIFKVGDYETKEPYGKRGKSISVKSVLVTSSKQSMIAIIKLIEKTNLDIIDITTSGMVDYFNFNNPEIDDKNGIIINVGNNLTNISVFSKGIFINNEIINIGGYDIDKDIALIYNIKMKDAKLLKEKLALASSSRAEPKETMKVINKQGEEVLINQYEITEVVSSRLNEILKITKKVINHLTKKEISYIIITGGLTEIKDFPLKINYFFKDKAQIGNINTIGARENKYSVAIGMLIYFNKKLKLRNKEYSTIEESDIELMSNKDSKYSVPNDSILGKIFGYFFDN